MPFVLDRNRTLMFTHTQFAALTLATAGRIEEAHAERGRINTLRPDYNFKHFKNAFHLLDDLKDIYQRAAKLVQIPV